MSRVGKGKEGGRAKRRSKIEKEMGRMEERQRERFLEGG